MHRSYHNGEAYHGSPSNKLTESIAQELAQEIAAFKPGLYAEFGPASMPYPTIDTAHRRFTGSRHYVGIDGGGSLPLGGWAVTSANRGVGKEFYLAADLAGLDSEAPLPVTATKKFARVDMRLKGQSGDPPLDAYPPNPNAHMIIGDIRTVPLPDQSVNNIYARDVMLALHADRRVLEQVVHEARRVLNPLGSFVMREPALRIDQASLLIRMLRYAGFREVYYMPGSSVECAQDFRKTLNEAYGVDLSHKADEPYLVARGQDRE